MTMKTVLVAGATGYLGSRLVRRLLQTPAVRVIALKRVHSDTSRLAACLPSITMHDWERPDLPELFRREPIDAVIQCMADYGRSGSSLSRIAEANLMLPLRLWEQAQAHGCAVFVNAGTSLPACVNAYALAKQQFAGWLEHHSSMTSVNLVLEHFFGPGEDPSKFIAFLVDNFLRPAPELNLTAAEQRRDFIYIDDVVEAFVTVLAAAESLGRGYHAIPVGSGHAYRLRDVVETVQRLTGNFRTRVNFGAVPYRAHEVMESRADIRRLTRLGWKPRHSLEDGLLRTVEVEQRKRRVA